MARKPPFSRTAKSEVTKKGHDGFIKLNVSPADKIFPRSPWLARGLLLPPRKELTTVVRTRPFRVRFPSLPVGLLSRG
jgi:hypothetical protein